MCSSQSGKDKIRFVFCFLAGLLTTGGILPRGLGAAPSPAASKVSVKASSVDLRPEFVRRGLAPRRQGDRGTCSVFAITGAIEYALADKRSRATRLSIEFLNWASNQAIKRNDDGGFFSDLWRGYESYGVCDESQMPYRAQFDPERQPSQAALARARKIRAAELQLHWIKPWDPHRGLTAEQFDAVKETLRHQWPVCGGFLWPQQAEWVDGVLQMVPRDRVRDGHSVLLVGFRDDIEQPGGGVFLVRNTGKGPHDGAMSYEYVRTYMNDAVWIRKAESPASP